MNTATAQRTAELVTRFADARIAVVGDFIADIYMEARPRRLSREAPVMIVGYENERLIPGGAANAVNNLCALGAQVFPVGVLGDDREGSELREFLEENTADAGGVLVQEGLATVSKTRVMVGEEGRSRQQVMRIDREPHRTLLPETRQALHGRLEAVLGDVDAVILSDYGYEILDDETIGEVLGGRGECLVTADSRYSLSRFQGVDLVSPNHDEAVRLVGHPVVTEEECSAAAGRIMEQLQSRIVLLTLGNRGMMLLEQGQDPVFIPAHGASDEVTDVSGAGDTVISLVTLGLSVGATALEAAHLANFGAGVVVTKLGAATCSTDELVAAGSTGQAG